MRTASSPRVDPGSGTPWRRGAFCFAALPIRFPPGGGAPTEERERDACPTTSGREGGKGATTPSIRALPIMNTASDASLVAQCLDGRREGYAELVRRYQGPVFGLAYRMTRSHEDAEDLAQETFIQAYRKLQSYDTAYPFRAWVLRICANRAKNRFRSTDRRRRAEEAHVEIHPPDAGAMEPDLVALDEAIARIPQMLRIPLVLKHVEGLPYEEIAQVLGIGISAAKMRVKRGRDELVRLLHPESGRVTQ
ncbi:RNA polymerase sigma factor [Candidatus Fermentibacteria bacterium]|nr:RNA polymerase sigma factor [Candidatus Fermentibacteria bacterium]